MAERLVEGMVSKFDVSKYEDEYRRDLMRLIQRKVKAGQINSLPKAGVHKAKPAAKAKVVDLAELLAQSVAGSKRGHRAEPRHRKSA